MRNKLPVRAEKISTILKAVEKSFNFNKTVNNSRCKKGKLEWVSSFDLEISKFITSKIHTLFPQEKVISEEGNSFNYKDSFWTIDPIDGTHNFLAGSSVFAISIAYCQDKQVKASGMLLPKLNETWISQKDKGVWLNNTPFKRKPSNVKPFAIGNSALRNSSKHYPEKLKSLSLTGFSPRLTGSTSFDFVALARTSGVIIIEKPNLYDIAPGLGIIQELGGKVLDFSQSKWELESKSMVATLGLSREQEKALWKAIIV